MFSTKGRTSGKELLCNGSFHEAFGPVLIVAQCLAMLPVTGVKSSSAYGLNFSWRSYRAVYSVIAFGFATLYTIFATCITLTKPLTFNSFGLYHIFYFNFFSIKIISLKLFLIAVPLAFFSTTAYGVLNFILLARKWPALMQHWESVESALPPYTKNAQKKRLGRKIRTISIVVLSVALGTP